MREQITKLVTSPTGEGLGLTVGETLSAMRVGLMFAARLRGRRGGARGLRPAAQPGRPPGAQRPGRPDPAHRAPDRRPRRRARRGGDRDAVERAGARLVRRSPGPRRAGPPTPGRPQDRRPAAEPARRPRPATPRPPAAVASTTGGHLDRRPGPPAASALRPPAPRPRRARSTGPATPAGRVVRRGRSAGRRRRTPRRRGDRAVPVTVKVACVLTWVFSGVVALLYLGLMVVLVAAQDRIVDFVVSLAGVDALQPRPGHAGAGPVGRLPDVPRVVPGRVRARVVHLEAAQLGALAAGGERRGDPGGGPVRLPGRGAAPDGGRPHDRRAVRRRRPGLVRPSALGAAARRRAAADRRPVRSCAGPPPPGHHAPADRPTVGRRLPGASRRSGEPTQSADVQVRRRAGGGCPRSSTSCSLQNAQRIRCRPSSRAVLVEDLGGDRHHPGVLGQGGAERDPVGVAEGGDVGGHEVGALRDVHVQAQRVEALAEVVAPTLRGPSRSCSWKASSWSSAWAIAGWNGAPEE